MSVSPERREEVVSTLRMVMGPTVAQLKCISCGLYQDADDENIVSFVQEWESQEALDEYIRSDEYRKILAVMDLASEPPEIKFITAVKTEGLELIEEIRGQLLGAGQY
jgi:quinol monooxygenase YgiN